MNGLTPGSPLSARLTTSYLPFILFFFGLVAVAIVIFFVTQLIKKHKESPEYLQKLKNRPTRLSDISSIARICNLRKEEADLLWDICSTHKTSNILYLAKDKDAFEELLKAEYYELKDRGDEKSIGLLFSLRKKMIISYVAYTVLKNSKAVDSETVFVYTAEKGIHYNLDYPEKKNDGLYLAMPPIFVASNDKPEPLQKISLTFIAKDDTGYRIDTRVMRYQKDKHGQDYMVCAHSDHLTPLKKRTSDRIETDINIQFAAVKVEKTGSGKKRKVKYVPLEKRYPGKLSDISAGGCKILTRLPIRPDQHIYIEGALDTQHSSKATGLILRSTKRKDGLIVLHIKFVKIDQAVINNIHALACKY